MKKILITGCSGFIGFHLTRKFCENGFDVIGVDNMNDYYDVSLKESRLSILKDYNNFSFKKIDISIKENLNDLFRTDIISFIIHLAAQAGVRSSINKPEKYINSNIIGFLNILEVCKNQKINLFYASSSSIYGNSKKTTFKESDRTDSQVSFYGVTKKTNELMAFSYKSLYNINSIGFRFFTVYGPWGRPDMAYFSFTKKILKNKNIDIYNDGHHSRSFTYIDDIIESIYLMYKKYNLNSNFCEVLNIGSNKSIALLDMLNTIELELKKKSKKNYLPIQKGDVLKTVADCNKLNKLINFTPRTNLNEGISKFIEWYLDYFNEEI